MKAFAISVLSVVCMSGCGLLLAPPSTPSVSEAERIEAIVQRGVQAMQRGDLTRADAAFALALEIGSSAAALDGHGCVALLQGDFEVAERYFLTALGQDPKYRGALGNLALLYDISGRPVEAAALYESAIRALPTNVALRNNFAALLADNKEQKTFSGRQGAEDPTGLKYSRAARELRKAATLAAHPIVMSNLERMEAP